MRNMLTAGKVSLTIKIMGAMNTDAKLKRRVNQYLSEAGGSQL